MSIKNMGSFKTRVRPIFVFTVLFLQPFWYIHFYGTPVSAHEVPIEIVGLIALYTGRFFYRVYPKKCDTFQRRIQDVSHPGGTVS